MTRDDYLLDNQQAEAGERFDALAELFNPSTFQRMDAIGLTPGWRVWEVGAGGASVPSWIAARTKGYVLATDLDTSWLEGASAPYVVKRHDIGTDPAPDGLFDLVHARLVLVHVPERRSALLTMISAVRPGGWLFLEEADPGPSAARLSRRVWRRTASRQQAQTRVSNPDVPAGGGPFLRTDSSETAAVGRDD